MISTQVVATRQFRFTEVRLTMDTAMQGERRSGYSYGHIARYFEAMWLAYQSLWSASCGLAPVVCNGAFGVVTL